MWTHMWSWISVLHCVLMYRKGLLLVYSSARVTVHLVGSACVYVCRTFTRKQRIRILVLRVFFWLNNLSSEGRVYQISYPFPASPQDRVWESLCDWSLGAGTESLRSTFWLQLLLLCFVKSWIEQVMLVMLAIRLRWDWFFSGFWVFVLAPIAKVLGPSHLIWV